MGIPEDQIGGHANILDTSEMLFVNAKHVRMKKLAPGGGYENSGVSGDPTQVDGRARQGVPADQDQQRPRAGQGADGGDRSAERTAGTRWRRCRSTEVRRRRWGRAAVSRRAQPAGPPPPTFETAPAGTPSQAPDTVFIDELTWEETRDALKAGKRTVIIPTGGTEKNGYHMVLGKHNFIVTHSANLMARRLKNALVAPTIQYVPEGDPDRAGPGVISLPSPAYDMLLDAAARSLQGARLHRHPLHRRQRRQSGRA